MPIKYIPYEIQPLRGQAVLPFLRYQRQLTARDFRINGMPYYEVELQEKVNGGSKNSKDNLLIHGDCLNACAYLKEKAIKVDLVYIDPPFASGANYAKKIYIRRNPKLVEKIDAKEKELKKTIEQGIEVDNKELQAIEEIMYGDIWQKEDYLNWMYERLLAIKEIMSETASIYVHLDWHIGHYVKILMDEIFGEENFRNEIQWKRSDTSGGRNAGKLFINVSDTIIFYAKSKGDHVFNRQYIPYDKAYIDKYFTEQDENGRRYQARVYGTRKQYLDESFGVPVSSIWDDISNIAQYHGYEYLDYPTQKPEALLNRIISASTNKGMVVADFFSGSGVTASVAHKLERKFISADVGINSIQTTRDRLVEIGTKFDILKVKDGIDLFRNPEQTMQKIAKIIPGLSTKHDYGSFWFGALVDNGKVSPCWIPDLKNKSTAILNAALFTKILDETAKLEGVSQVIVCSIDKIDDEEIRKMIKDYDIRDINGKPIEFIFKDLKELTDVLVYPDIVQYHVNKIEKEYGITFDRFISDNLLMKIKEFNGKKQKKDAQINLEETSAENEEPINNINKQKVQISEEGLELIEYLSIDSTNTEGVWQSDYDLKIDKKGYCIINGKKTKEFWDGKVIVAKKPLRIKVRNIAGDETILSLI